MDRELRWAAVLMALAALAAPPLAAALDASGSFAIVGGVSLPEGSRIQGAPLALLAHDGRADAPILGEFRLSAREMQVWVLEEEELRVDATLVHPEPASVVVTKRNATYLLHDVTVTLLDQGDGAFLGADLSRGGDLALASEGRASVEARERTLLASHNVAKASARRETHYYHRDLAEPHLLATALGSVRYEGGLALKTANVALLVEADENSTRLVTGTEDGRDSGWNVRRWVVFEARDAVLEAIALRPLDAAFVRGDVEWSGQAAFRCVGGVLTTAGRTYPADSGTIQLEGAFKGTLFPETGHSLTRARLSVQGDLATATLATSANSVSSVGPAPFLLPWLGLVGGMVLALGAGALVLRRRRRQPPSMGGTPEECVQRANDLIQAGYYTAATRWLAKARRLAPTSASVCASQAFVLGEVGKVEEALQAYLEASRLDPGEGEHALSAARLAHKAGRRPELVEDLLEQALARSPRLVEEIDADEFFDGLVGRPRFDHLVERAWRRHTTNLSAPDDAEDL